MLWGSKAISKEVMIEKSKHLILKSVHPSPLSAHRGFFGCKHFSKANEFLRLIEKPEIDW
jgi:uracil-DNA glycosylase